MPDVPWPEVAAWLRAKEVCWAVPIAGGVAFVTRCDGREVRTLPPDVDTLPRLVGEVDPTHDAIGFTLHYAEHVEIPWSTAAALFPTGTVWEVEVNQGLRVFLTTVADGAPAGRFATMAPDRGTLERGAATAPGPLFVKLFFVEEIPWRRAAALVSSRSIASASSVHVGRAFLRGHDGRTYLAIPSPPGSLERLLQAHDPGVSLTTE